MVRFKAVTRRRSDGTCMVLVPAAFFRHGLVEYNTTYWFNIEEVE